MNDTTITCPKCGADIPLTEAVSHRLREQLETEFEQRRTELNGALASRERQLAAERAAIEKRAREVGSEIDRQLASERDRLITDAMHQAEEKMAARLKDLQSQNAEQRDRLKAAQNAELALLKQKREIEEARAALELETARRLDAERQKIADAARQQVLESERLKLADKDNVIKDLQEQIAILQQRAGQGSMQLQGETLELDLEQQLRATFRHDDITEVKKGQRGADITQRVRAGASVDCGTILWEAKRAKNWSPDWIEKLKEDQREVKAELAAIVTTCPPDGLRGIGLLDGVWVCEPAFAVGLAAALRHGLVSTAVQRVQQENRTCKMAALYDHLCSVEFRQHIEALVESFVGLQDQLMAEQRAFARQWKEREHRLQKAISHTALLYGGIQGIAGREALPEIEILALPQ